MIRAAALLAGLIPSIASAHDQWANGVPIPPYVKDSCCGVSDAHHLRSDQDYLADGTVRFDGYNKPVEQKQLMPSPDNEVWVFYRDYPDGSQSSIYCAFVGPMGF